MGEEKLLIELRYRLWSALRQCDPEVSMRLILHVVSHYPRSAVWDGMDRAF
jgi:hypothetical protein